MSRVQKALELRKAVQILLGTLDPGERSADILAVPSVFPAYRVGKSYAAKEVFRWGENAVGDPQLWEVLQAHTSSETWPPDTSPSLYKRIGVSEDGTPEWTQPLGASDAYQAGDVVMYKGAKYRSLIDGNVWSPEAYPQGWEVVTE